MKGFDHKQWKGLVVTEFGGYAISCIERIKRHSEVLRFKFMKISIFIEKQAAYNGCCPVQPLLVFLITKLQFHNWWYYYVSYFKIHLIFWKHFILEPNPNIYNCTIFIATQVTFLQVTTWSHNAACNIRINWWTTNLGGVQGNSWVNSRSLAEGVI